ncbi:hypothetical protein MIT9_P0849 [Methylomarinovum caldicuralii]|uniref:NolW-like domain-containing protein n=1 Tax=Methylomarinovum caldicuralii TaxID=438856 RepID=A0AAU9CI51_9GAMM|nr:secretin N-terminal domain-containing protein [Methylomarinovum caldicuralii]BCX81271.1 hypothetical protein MIT9_P0849 [Methylomarinovum caldicuralii]
MTKIWMLALLLWFPPLQAATVTIPVSHRPPAELARILAPLLERDEAVVPVPDALVVKAPEGRVGEIRRLVKQLDRPLRTLTIRVIQSDRLTRDELEAGGGFSATLTEGPIRARGHVYRTESDRGVAEAQHLKVLEGQPAFIAVGEERPVPRIWVGGQPPAVMGGIAYKPVTSGFRVVPRVVGCRVRLEIAPWSQRAGDLGDARIEVRSAATVVEVPAGRWIELGGSDRAGTVAGGGIGLRQTTERRHQRIFLRVDPPEGC